MTRDISAILEEWEFQPGQLAARVIAGEDGEPRLQVRLDLGMLQMHLEGRPDGQSPMGFRSLLDYFESQFEATRTDGREPFGSSRHEEMSGEEPEGMDSRESEGEDISSVPKQQLEPEECRGLREELSQFNQRAVALMAMDDFERVVRDAGRNLRVLDMCRERASAEQDQTVLEQYRPYFIAMKFRAQANMAVRDHEVKAAVLVLDEGLDALKASFAQAGKAGAFEQSPEAQSLRSLRESIVPQLPLSQRSELRRRLAEALEQENYELAAILRDELKQLKE
jgi:hypothetical protein